MTASSKDYSAADVAAAAGAIKAQEIQDKAFCERIVAAGYVGYFVTAYHGRIRDRHVEWFPSAKRQTMMIDVEKRSMPRRSMCL
jgi:hypothetical protein